MMSLTQATTLGSVIWLREVSDGSLGDVALRVDRPLDDEVALDARVILERGVVAGARLVPVGHDDGADVRGAAPGLVRGGLCGAGPR